MSNIVLYNPLSVVPNQVTDYLISVNTPDYDINPYKVVDPDVSALTSVPVKYWIVSGTDVLEMNQTQKDTIDTDQLPLTKSNKKTKLASDAKFFIASRGYTNDMVTNAMSLYSNGIRAKPKRAKYLQPLIDWLHSVDVEVDTKQKAVDTATTMAEVNVIYIDTVTLASTDPAITITDSLAVIDASDLDPFLDANAEVTDPDTGKKGPFYLMQELQHRKDLYNDTENPLYFPGHVPILGANGILQDHADRVLNLEDIHQKTGWHEGQVFQALNKRPKDLLIYYGYLNSFNSGVNGWDNEKVAKDMSKYNIIVIGDGVENPTHPDYVNTQIIIPRIKELNPDAIMFGYVALAQLLADFQTKVDQWNTLAVHGIFIDEAGYDYGKNRAEFNACVDYVHGKTNSRICFANAWNTDHILGTTDDVSFPNSTYNPGLVESHLTQIDWILLESFAINTQAYTSTSGYESSSDWQVRGQKAINLRAEYGVNFAGSGIINNANVNGQNLFTFGYLSAVMYSLEAWGTSDTSYAASSVTVTYWNRSDLSGIGNYYEQWPSVVVDNADADVFLRYTNAAIISVDFSTSAQTSSITKFPINSNGSGQSGYSGFSGYSGVGTSGYSGASGYSGIGISGYSGAGSSGYSGESTSGYSGESGYSGQSGYSGNNGYALTFSCVNQATTTDSQTVYWGGLALAQQTTAGIQRLYIPKSGQIKICYLYLHSGTVGTGENWSMYIRKNNTTDTLVETIASAAAQRIWTNTSLAIDVVAGDYIEIKEIQPAWATNPANVRRSGVIYIE